MAIDTAGLSQLIPELATAFPQNFPVVLSAVIDPVDNLQPIISTNLEKSRITLDGTIDFKVVNSTDPFDNPFPALSLKLQIDAHLQLSTTPTNITIAIVTPTVTSITPVSNIGEIKVDRIQASINGLLDIVSKQVNGMLHDIDLNKLLTDKLGVGLKDFDIDYNNEYFAVSFDLVK